MENSYEKMNLTELRKLAKERQIKSPTTKNKSELIELLLASGTKQEAVVPIVEAVEEKVEKTAEKEPEKSSSETVRESGTSPGSGSRGNISVTFGQGSQRRYPGNNTGRTASYQDRRNRDDRYDRSGRYQEQRTTENRNAAVRREAPASRTEGTAGTSVQSPNPEAAAQALGTQVRETAAPVSEDKIITEMADLDSGEEASGILDVLADGYGFIRSNGYLTGDADVYVAPSQIRKFNLKTGDHISGNIRIRTMQEKFSALLYLKSVNGLRPSEAARRTPFEEMTPIFPDQRLRMERRNGEMAMRVVDLISPIGKGQRGMIVSPPKAGKTTLLKDIAKSILVNNPSCRLIILLIDERPEEVTDIREAIIGDQVEVVASTFDEQPDHHRKVAEMVMERAKRLVEAKEDVIILLDSITRLARACNLVVPPSGKTLSGGLDPTSLYMPKRFFGAARNMREGGSLTILATALIDTGSKMDDVIYEEFKGTGNMELVLDRKLSERRVFPAIDVQKSSTRREDLLLDKDEQDAVYILRKALNRQHPEESIENILNLFSDTISNRDFIEQVKRKNNI